MDLNGFEETPGLECIHTGLEKSTLFDIADLNYRNTTDALIIDCAGTPLTLPWIAAFFVSDNLSVESLLPEYLDKRFCQLMEVAANESTSDLGSEHLHLELTTGKYVVDPKSIHFYMAGAVECIAKRDDEYLHRMIYALHIDDVQKVQKLNDIDAQPCNMPDLIVPTDPLQCFLYLLLRDKLPAGEVESLTRQADVDEEIVYCNEHLANYAKDLAHRLRKN